MRLGRTTAAGAIILMVALTGCNGNDNGTNKADDTTTPTESTDTGVITPPGVPEVPTLKKSKGIVADTTMDKCGVDPGKVDASGSVTNSSKSATDLVVSVAWVAPTGSDVLGRGVATFKHVAPGDTKDWSVSAELADGVEAQCVLSAYAGQLDKP